MINITDNKLQELTKIFQPVTSYKFSAIECVILVCPKHHLIADYMRRKLTPFLFYWFSNKREKVEKNRNISMRSLIETFIENRMHIGVIEYINTKTTYQPFINGATSGIERRWICYLYHIDEVDDGNVIAFSYSARVYNLTMDPVINMITAYIVQSPKVKFKNHPQLYTKYKELVAILSKKDHNNKKEVNPVKFTTRNGDSNDVGRIYTKNELKSLPLNELDQLIPLDEDATICKSNIVFTKCKKDWYKLPYYDANDELNEPYYEMRFDEVIITSEMEERRIKYNHNNVDVLNELVDQYFERNHNKIIDYDPINGWPKYHNVVTAIGHGFPQVTIYKALQECFGEIDACNTWLKYYDELPVKESNHMI